MPQGPDRIPFEGVLNCWNDDHDLPDLLLSISRSGKTGQLHFSNPEGDKTLDLSGGRIVFAESSSQDDGLGQYLLRTGKISLMDYTRVSKKVQPGKRLGALLVEEEVLAPSELVPAVVGQVRAVILGLFRRTETWYRFKEHELEKKEAITLDLAVPELILEGVHFVESWRRVSKGVGSLESVYRTDPASEGEWEESQLDDGARELIRMLATPTSLAEICERATVPDFDACRYLWAFRSLGWIDLVDAAAREQRPSVAADAPEAPVPVSAEPPPEAPSVPTPAGDTPTVPSMPTPVEETPAVPPVAASVEDPAALPPEDTPTIVSKRPLVPPESEPFAPPTPADAPALTSSPPKAAAPTTENLAQTQMAIDPPSSTPASGPASVPERLVETEIANEVPPGFGEVEESFAPEPPAPTPIPDHLAATQLSIEPPPEITPAPPTPAAPAPIPDELLHTQMFVEPPTTAPAPTTDEPAPPRSTGELMESILGGDDPAPPSIAPPATPPQPSPPPQTVPPVETTPEPPAPSPDNSTQFFAGPNALEPPHTKPPAAPPPPAATEPATAPSGFEALMADDPLASTPAPPATPIAKPAAPPPSPADTPTQPSVHAPPQKEGTLASFEELSLSSDPLATAEPTPTKASPPEPMPMVEADVVTGAPAVPAPPAEGLVPDGFAPPAFSTDDPLVPQQRELEVTRESLTPPRRRTDDVDLDDDGLGHILGVDRK